MPTPIPRWILITIRSIGVFSGIVCLFILLSFASLAIAISFGKQNGNINPWIFSAGLFALLVLLIAAGYTAKTLFFSPIHDLVKQLPSCMGFSSFLISSICLYAFSSHDLPRGHSHLDFSMIAAPWFFAWIGYRLTKTFIERSYLSITAGDAKHTPHDCPRCGFYILESAANCPNCHEPVHYAENKKC